MMSRSKQLGLARNSAYRRFLKAQTDCGRRFDEDTERWIFTTAFNMGFAAGRKNERAFKDDNRATGWKPKVKSQGEMNMATKCKNCGFRLRKRKYLERGVEKFSWEHIKPKEGFGEGHCGNMAEPE
jgi:hypothetical protein